MSSPRAAVICFGLLLTACGGSTFSGASKTLGGGKAKPAPQPKPEGSLETEGAPPKEPAAPSSDSVDDAVGPASPAPAETNSVEEANASAAPPPIAECLKAWKGTKIPFTNAELANPTVVNVTQSNNNNAIAYADSEKTDKPKLILINVESKNVNQGDLELLNPNGWYCVDVQSKAANNFTIKTTCTSVVATLSHSSHVENGFTISREPCP